MGGAGPRLDRNYLHGYGHLSRTSPSRTNPEPGGNPEYWQAKVVESQARITCELLNLYLDGDTAIVEWEAEFDDVAQSVRKRMREVAILVFEGQLIASLREYWSSEPIGRIPQLLRAPAESPD